MSLIEIRAFGPFELRGPGEQVDPAAVLSRAKRAAVLAYLACARPYGPRGRDELLGVFWPELDQAKAGRALNQSVYVLRSVLGEDVISTRGSEVGLDAGVVWSDVVAFQEALDTGDLDGAIALYRGEFLQGLYLSGARNFERWLDDEREFHSRRAVDVADRLSAREEAAGSPAEALRWMRRALEIAPYDERRFRRLLGLLVAGGDRATAARELDRFACRLREDLGDEVSDDTRDVVRGPTVEGIGESAALAASATRPGRPQRSDPRSATASAEAPSVGRAPDDAARNEAVPSARPDRRTRIRVSTGLGVVGIFALAIGALAWFDRQQPPPTDPARVLVAPFENRTDDPSLDALGRIAADWVARGLIGTGLLEVVPRTMTPDDRARWPEVGAAAGAGMIVTGSIQREPPNVVLAAQVLDVASGAIVRSLDPVVAPAGSPLEAIEQLRRRIAGALATAIDPRMSEWADAASQPPSFESYRTYAEGLELLEAARYADAADRFLEAAERDSTFTAAVVWALEAYSLTGDGPIDSLAFALAARRDRLAPWDRTMLDHHLARLHGDLDGEYEALRKLVRLSPTGQWRVLLAQQAIWLNRPSEAARILADIDPESVRGIPERMYWGLTLHSMHMRGLYAEELAFLKRWRTASHRLPSTALAAEFRALAAVGRPADVLRLVESDRRFDAWTWQTADRLRRIALELRVHGHPAASARVLDRVFELYGAAPDSVRRDPTSRRQLGRALRTAGRWAESREVFEGLLDEGHDPHITRGDLAVAAAALGDRELAEEVDRWYADWAAANPRQNGWATQWRSRIAALLGDRDRAVLLIAQAHEEGWPHWAFDELVEEYDGLRGYAPFEEVMRARG